MSPHIVSFHIYMDDALLTWKGTLEELDLFINKINDLHPTLKFTYTASEERITFLDLEIFKGNRFQISKILDISCHTKATETWCYLQRDSCHNPAVFKAFIKGELIRYARNCNNHQSYEEKKNIFSEKLMERGYTKDEFEEASKEVFFTNRETYIAEKVHSETIPLVFKQPYFPHISGKHIKNAILKHWDIIRDHDVLSNIFNKPPILAFKRTKNLSDSLVRARFNTLKIEEQVDSETTTPVGEETSNTLQNLQYLEMESRGFNDNFFYDYVTEEI